MQPNITMTFFSENEIEVANKKYKSLKMNSEQTPLERGHIPKPEKETDIPKMKVGKSEVVLYYGAIFYTESMQSTLLE